MLAGCLALLAITIACSTALWISGRWPFGIVIAFAAIMIVTAVVVVVEGGLPYKGKVRNA